MQLEDAINFLFIIMMFLWLIKADLFFIIFGATVYLFIVFFIFAINPFRSGTLIINDLLINPTYLILPFIPLFIYIVFNTIKKGLKKTNK